MIRRSTGAYPANWSEIAKRVKDAAGWECVRCRTAHDIAAGYMLTVHHLDLNPANNAWWNTVALCQRCHLRIQHRVILERPWVMDEHSPWFRPYVAGWYAHRYLGLNLSREDTEARMPELLALERRHVLGIG